MDVSVTNAPERHRFEAWADGELAGFAQYIRRDGLIVFTHTEVNPEFEGHGVGGTLAQVALDDSSAHELRVRAQCPFIAAWIERHPAYKRLLEAEPGEG
jgi:uncharacterized protein